MKDSRTIHLEREIGGRPEDIRLRCTLDFKLKTRYYSAKYFHGDMSKLIRYLLEKEFETTHPGFNVEWENRKPRMLNTHEKFEKTIKQKTI